VTRFLVGDWIADSARLPFAPEHPGAAMHYAGLSCSCGARVFRLHGWPRSVVGRGGYLWRSLVRVWREARLPMTGEEPGRSPFLLPIFLDCEHCDRSAPIFDEPGLPERIESEARSQPRESHRCRACRRGRMSLAVGWTSLPDELRERDEQAGPGPSRGSVDPVDPEVGRPAAELPAISMAGRAFELVARCQACQRQVRIVGGDARASLQAARLDLLYGRR
jgi:hypothetical protein